MARVGLFFAILSILPLHLQADNKYIFKDVIHKAKKRVFPALVFVKPIVEVFSSGKKQQQRVFGSGVIISSDGYVVTNNHVVENAKSIKCVLSDRRQVEANIIGLDKDTDLALLKLKLDAKAQPLPYAQLGDSSKLEEGQFVMAMGSPFGFSRSVSLGIVSYTRRYLSEGPYNLWIQTDAAINPGNSGGPLVNDQGQVVAINTLGAMMANNIAFSIPSNTVKEVIKVLKRDGKVTRTWTGITFQALRDYSRETIIDSEKGVLVAGVEENSPAEQANIFTGDIIIKVNQQPVNGIYLEDLPLVRAFFAQLPIDSTAKITLLRKKKLITLDMHLRPKGKVTGENIECTRWNMTLKGINRFANPNVAFFHEQGVFIQGIEKQGNAKISGFKRGDIIISIAGQEVMSLEQIASIYTQSLTKENQNKTLLFKVLRRGMPIYIVLDYRRDFEQMEEE